MIFFRNCGHGRGHVDDFFRNRGRGRGHDFFRGRGHGHDFFEKSRTRTQGRQSADTRVSRSLMEMRKYFEKWYNRLIHSLNPENGFPGNVLLFPGNQSLNSIYMDSVKSFTLFDFPQNPNFWTPRNSGSSILKLTGFTFSKMTGNLSEGFRILIYPKVFLDKKTCQFFFTTCQFFF